MINGRIWWLSYRKKYGIIRANTGENIPFIVKDYIGRKYKPIDLVEGDEVVYGVNDHSREYKAINVQKYLYQN